MERRPVLVFEGSNFRRRAPPNQGDYRGDNGWRRQ